jgi:hypothetical protein
MYNLSEFQLYEELLSFFALDGYQLLSKLNIKLPEITEAYSNLDCFRNCNSEDNRIEMNEYQRSIILMFNTLLFLWITRN